ncbi:MAG: cupin domain-containing protein [Rhodothermales bacterium]
MPPAEETRHTWSHIPAEPLTDLLTRKMIWGDRIMLAHIDMKKGSRVPTHRHDNEQFSYILSGALKFWVGEEEREVVVRAGEVLHLPSNLPHGAIALEDSLSLDVFSPPRQDWIDGTDDYLRHQK